MKATEISDKVLINDYLQGNQASLEKLIQRHKNRVYAYILMVVKDKQLADDIFQDTFIKVIKTLKRGKYNERGKFLPWVMRIAHNLIIDHFRKGFLRVITRFQRLEVFYHHQVSRVIRIECPEN